MQQFKKNTFLLPAAEKRGQQNNGESLAQHMSTNEQKKKCE
jgi:hypothetical protein